MAQPRNAPCTGVSAIRIQAVRGVAAAGIIRVVSVLCLVWVTAEFLPWIGSVAAVRTGRQGDAISVMGIPAAVIARKGVSAI